MEETWKLAAVSDDAEDNVNLTEDLLKQVQTQKVMLAKQEKAMELAEQRSRRLFVKVAFITILFVFFVSSILVITDEFREILSNLFGLRSILSGADILQWVLATIGLVLVGSTLARFLRDTVRSDEEIIDVKRSKEVDLQDESYVKFKVLGLDMKLNVPSSRDNFYRNDEYLYFMETGECGWLEPLIYSRDRLLSEIRRLHSRSSSNLTTGMIMSAMGVIFLLSMVIFPSWYSDALDLKVFSLGLDAKVLLFIFSQVLAGFFLKLFVGNEKSISELNKEVLTLDYRLSAAVSGLDNNVSDSIVAKFLNEERVKEAIKNPASASTNSLDIISDSLKEIKKSIVK